MPSGQSALRKISSTSSSVSTTSRSFLSFLLPTSILASTSPRVNSSRHGRKRFIAMHHQSRPVTVCTNQKLVALDKLAYTPPSLGSNPAFDSAMELLQGERSNAKKKLDALKSDLEAALTERAALPTTGSDASKSSKANELDGKINALQTKIRNLKVEYGFSDLKNHYLFNSRRAEPESLEEAAKELQLTDADPVVFEALKRRRFESFTVPKLVKAAQTYGLFEDVFPSEIAAAKMPKVNVEVNFSNTEWEGCYGHPVPPNWSLYSPKVTLTSPKHNTQYFTLLLADIDRPNIDLRCYEEWCHWLVTDIPMTAGRVMIPGGSSPFLAKPNGESSASTGSYDYHPSAPEEEPQIPGNIIFPYVPPHPPNSNPRKVHRYVLYAFGQKDGQVGSKIDMKEIKSKVAERFGKIDSSDISHRKSVYGEGEQKLQVRERSVFPAWKLKTDFHMSLAGYAFFTSSYNIHTSDIFTRLGIHEPVYGSVKHANMMVSQIQTATEVASGLAANGPISALSATELAPLNFGKVEAPPLVKRTTKRMLEAQKMEEDWRKQVEARNAKAATKGGKKEAAVATTGKKVPRVTVVGSAGLVKAKETDVAGKLVGGLTKKVLYKPYRYRNV
ncbi:MFT2-Corn MFT-like protein [Phlyctochytrium planicorne]|nr:MFT2-Corn MFT-like protein [Phlyctochytrium planicorne]